MGLFDLTDTGGIQPVEGLATRNVQQPHFVSVFCIRAVKKSINNFPNLSFIIMWMIYYWLIQIQFGGMFDELKGILPCWGLKIAPGKKKKT